MGCITVVANDTTITASFKSEFPTSNEELTLQEVIVVSSNGFG